MTPEQQRWLAMRTAYQNLDYNNCHGSLICYKK